MSEFNTPERCITKFMQQLKESQERQSPFATDDFKAGFEHACMIAEIWFKDQIVKIKEDEPCAKA